MPKALRNARINFRILFEANAHMDTFAILLYRYEMNLVSG